MRTCRSKADSVGRNNISIELMELSSKEIIQRTGCMVPCSAISYSMVLDASPQAEVDPDLGVDPNTPHQMFEVYISDGTVVETIERKLYTLDDFVADVGGYLGLLVGVSMLAIYDWACKVAGKVLRQRSRSSLICI